MENLNVDKKVEILAKFPDLVARVTCTNSPLSKASIGERQSAGLYSLTPEERKYLTNLGNNYRDKFGFTFVICARQNKIQSILSGLGKQNGKYNDRRNREWNPRSYKD